MAQELAITARGLVTSPNPLSVPKDALTTALNVVIDRPGLIQSATGYAAHSTLGASFWKLFEANGKLWANTGNTSSASALRYWSGAAWTSVSGTFANVASQRMRHARAGSNTYVTAAAGVSRIDPSDGVTNAGAPKALGLDRYGPASVLAGTGGFLADGFACAYRAVIGTKDSSGNLLLGSPSSRTVITNDSTTSGYAAGVAKNVEARVLLPTQNNTASTALTTSYFVQLYRSAQVAVGTTPSDELQLVYEAYLSASDITNRYVKVSDITPDSQRGAFLYTNPSTGDEGIVTGLAGVANEPPPTAADAAFWQGCLWLAQPAYRQHLQFQILGTGSTGLAATHTLTIAGVTYTAIAPGAPAANQFVVETAGTASQNIEATALNLVATINKSASNSTVWAYYVSGSAPDAPGKILIENRLASASGFTVQASANGTAYAPSLASAVSSSADSYTNGVAFSRSGLPESFPALNLLRVGPTSATVFKMQPLGESLFVFTDAGLYRVRGSDYSNFAVDPVDLTAILLGRETVAVLDNDIYAWTTQGVARINDSGVTYVSLDIDSDLRALVATGADMARYAFAVAHQADHRYMLWHPTSNTDTMARAAYVFNTRTLAWTYRQLPNVSGSPDNRSCGFYGEADGLTYLGDVRSPGDARVYVERRDFASTDYRDTLSDGTTVGMTRTVTWAAQDAGNAGLLKRWPEVQFLFGSNPPVTLSGSLVGDFGTVSLSATGSASLRLQRFLNGPAASLSTRLAVTLTDSTSGEALDVAGLSLFYRPVSSRGMK